MWTRFSAGFSARCSGLANAGSAPVIAALLALVCLPATPAQAQSEPVVHFTGPDPMGCGLLVHALGADLPAVRYAALHGPCPDGMLWDAARERTLAVIAGALVRIDWSSGDTPILAETVPGWDTGWDWEIYIDSYTDAIRVVYADEVVDVATLDKGGPTRIELAGGETIEVEQDFPADAWMAAVMAELGDDGGWQTLVVEPSHIEMGGQSPLWPLVERILPAPGSQWMARGGLAIDTWDDWRSVYDAEFPAALRTEILRQLTQIGGRDAGQFDDVQQLIVGNDTLIVPTLWGDRPHPHGPLAWCGGTCGDALRPLDLSALPAAAADAPQPRTFAIDQQDGWLLVIPEDIDAEGALVFQAGQTAPSLILTSAGAATLLAEPDSAAGIFQRAFGDGGGDDGGDTGKSGFD